MREYPVRKTIKSDNDYIKSCLESQDMEYKIDGDHIIASYPGILKLEIWTDGKKVYAETEADKNYSNPQETIKKFNNLIEKITGYSSKERKKLISK